MSKKLIRLDSDKSIAACTDSEALIGALKECAADILRNLGRMAAILRRLDELGIKVEIDHALLPYIRMIANGSLSAECFIAVCGDPTLLDRATKLPLDLQKRIAGNEPFKVLEADGKHRMVGALDMNRGELAQVFTGNRERTDEEKREFVKPKRPQSWPKEARQAPRALGGRSLANVAGTGILSGVRCPGCGAKLLPGAECLKCKLSDPDALDDLEDDEGVSQRSELIARNRGTPETDAQGWQDRLATLRAAKQSGDELGFHVNWLLNYLDGWDSTDGWEKLSQLCEALASTFDYVKADCSAAPAICCDCRGANPTGGWHCASCAAKRNAKKRERRATE